MNARRFRVKLLLDEGLPKRQSFSRLNDLGDLKHIKHELTRSGIPDAELYNVATSEGRIIVTLNIRDFQRFLRKDGSSIIGLSPQLTNQQIDSKLVALINRLQPHHLLGHFFKVDRMTRATDLIA
jgi:predicted nuclease of predicted toxin-antitoxin system